MLPSSFLRMPQVQRSGRRRKKRMERGRGCIAAKSGAIRRFRAAIGGKRVQSSMCHKSPVKPVVISRVSFVVFWKKAKKE